LQLLGNDIVDLRASGVAGKSRHARFVNRVFSDDERSAIHTAQDADLTLWLFWAAKETAFKVISKVSGPPVFAHKKFATTLLEPASPGTVPLTVTHGTHTILVEAALHKDYVHAVGTLRSEDDPADVLAGVHRGVHAMTEADREEWGDTATWHSHFNQAELGSIRRAESALVRFHCKNAIAEELGIPANRLQIVRHTRKGKTLPPFVLLDNQPWPDIDISLSHHGGWLAWCFYLKAAEPA